jgi:protein-tyrosine sulfotransferase
MPESDRKHPEARRIFILSTHRSGSSLLRYIIDTHPRICCPGEVYLGQICHLLCTAYYYTTGQALSPVEIERRKLAWKEVRSIVDNLMNSYAAIKNKDIWCEKTPNNVNYIRVLRNVFPDAAFICLYRNCMDFVNSCLEYSRYGFM